MFRTKKQYWQSVSAALVLVIGLLASTTLPVARAGDDDDDIAFQPHTMPFGNTYGYWSAKWWQWQLSFPTATNPNLDLNGVNCAEGQSGKVWFLAGTFGGAATRTCTVPHGKGLLFPILCTAFGAAAGDCNPTVPGVVCNVPALRAAAAATQDHPMLLQASLDGHPIRELSDYRVQSPIFSITLPPDAVFGLSPPGTWTPNISDGYWVMLEPLPAGHHTLHAKGVANNGFVVDVTYYLTIQQQEHDH